MVKVAVVQFRASTSKERNLEKILGFISRAAKNGAGLVAFPEFMMFYTPATETPQQLSVNAERITGNFVSTIAKSARDNAIEVVGTFYEKSPRRNRVYDTSFLADATGRITSKYRKIHLYDALGFKESGKMASGSRIAMPRTSRIGKLGMLICYDLRFPEISRTLASSGSEVIVAPSAWVRGRSKEDHWVTINKARAIENGCYMISPDQTGNIYCGRSMVVDPYGKVLLDMKKRQGIGYVEIRREKIRQTRRALPLLKNRRTDIYSGFKI